MNIQDVRCFLLDMDGTFYLGEKIIPGSLEFIRRVEETGRDFLFLTNNSSHNADFYVQRLKRMGLNVGREKVLTSGEATAAVLKETYPGKRAFVLGNEFLLEEMREAGVTVDQTDPEIVVVGYDTTLDYKKMTAVCDLVRAGLPYIATHPDFNCPTETGFAPDIGAIMAFIEASTGRRADLVVGKPHTGIVQAALRRTGLQVGQMAMVGDRLYTDVRTGVDHGLCAILVLSGEGTLADIETMHIEPDLIFARLGSMIPYL